MARLFAVCAMVGQRCLLKSLLKSLTFGAVFKAPISQCWGTVDQVEACVPPPWVGVEVEVIVFCVLVNIGLDVLGVHMLSCVCVGDHGLGCADMGGPADNYA